MGIRLERASQGTLIIDATFYLFKKRNEDVLMPQNDKVDGAHYSNAMYHHCVQNVSPSF